MIKVSDLIANILIEEGIEHVFMLTGGGAMHLNYSLGTNKNLKCIFNHHEQACSIAAEGYSRVSGKMVAVNITTGPGGLNTLTGLMGQWTDSVPVIYISGQVKQETTIGYYKDLKIRQVGDQEVDIINIVKNLTKFSVSITEPTTVKYFLKKAIHIAKEGRPGPVWIDVPMDVQGAFVDESNIKDFFFEKQKQDNTIDFEKIIHLLKNAKRPVFIAGYGIRISNSISDFKSLLDKIKIPVVTSFNGMDIISDKHPYYIGRIGSQGDRAGNFAIQNADLIIAIGTRNNIRQTSYNWEIFAKNARKIVVDIDPSELKKRNLIPDIPVCVDAKSFIDQISKMITKSALPDWDEWLKWNKLRKKKYPVVLKEYKESENINPYYFIKILCENLRNDAVIVTANGSASVCTFQAGLIKEKTRVIMNSGCAPMGYELPAAIGASIAKNYQEIICIAGDGSFQLNLQEMQTLVNYKLPIKIFYFDNDGYSSIRQTQHNFFGDKIVGCDAESGLSFPDMKKIAKAYGVKTFTVNKTKNIKQTIINVLNENGAAFCIVKLTNDYRFMPKVSSAKLPDGRIVSKPLEDMFPFLSPEELSENMINV